MTREGLPDKYRAEVIDNYGVKLLTSGYGYDQTRRIIMGGAKGYLAKVRRRTQNGGKLHRTAEESSSWRWRKKLLGKSSWFKDKRTKEEDAPKYTRGEQGGRGTKGAEQELKTRAVCFVEQTPQGELAKRMREQLVNLAPTLGYRVRVVERTGIKMVSSFPQGRTWRGEQCGRFDCITCNQGTEELPDCTRPSVVYESICEQCNPGARGKGELKSVASGAPSLNVGESSRSVQERAVEHWCDAKKGAAKSNMVKHQAIKHPGEAPKFLFKVVSHHRSALNRQVREAVRIRRREGGGRQYIELQGRVQ